MKIVSQCAVIMTAFLLVVIAACNDSSPTSPTWTVSYARDIQPLLTQKCNFPGCHNSVDKQGGIDLTTWESMMYGGSRYGAEIIPFNAKWSHTVSHICYDTNVAPVALPHMPEAKVPYTNGQPLTAEQLRMVMQWINEGAKNDNGEVAFSNITGKAFITNQASDYVAVVDLDNFFMTRYVQVGPGGTQLAAPHNVFVDYQNKYFYVTLIAGHIVDKYDATTYEKVGSINFVYSPAHVIINHAGTKGFVTDYDLRQVEREVKTFDPVTMTEMNTISDITMNATHGEKITRDDKYLVTVAYLGEYAYVINALNDSIETMLPVDPQVPPNGNGTGFFRPIAISLSADDHYAFVTCASSNDVRVLDMTSRTFIRTIPVGIFPIQSECSPDGHWLYVADRNSDAVTVIDITTMTPVKTILGVGAQPHGVAFTKDGHYAFVSCESVGGTFVHHPVTGSTRPGTTAVIDAWNGHVKVKDIEMASFPAGVSIVH